MNIPTSIGRIIRAVEVAASFLIVFLALASIVKWFVNRRRRS